MKALVAIALAVATLVVGVESVRAQTIDLVDDQDCGDFATQADAQAHYRMWPWDPDKLDGLDRDGTYDGIACEDRPCRCDPVRVARQPFPTTGTISSSGATAPPITASRIRFGYGAGGPAITCPSDGVWLLAYWMGFPPSGVQPFSIHEQCIGVDAFWIYGNGQWNGVSPAAPDFANDVFDPPVGAAVWLRGAR